MTKEIRIDKESLVDRYPFMGSLIALEIGYGLVNEDLTILEGIISPELLERKSYDTEYRLYDDGLPSYRIYSENPLMPDKEGPVPTYAVKGETIKKLGLEYQFADEGYVKRGYDGHARLKHSPLSIKEELTLSKVEDPDFIVCRERTVNKFLRFEIYRREERKIEAPSPNLQSVED